MDQSPVVVWEAANVMEAEIVKSRLEADGIPAFIRSDAAGQIFGLTMGGLAAADVLVLPALADKAIALLEVDATDLDTDQEGEDESLPANEADAADADRDAGTTLT